MKKLISLVAVLGLMGTARAVDWFNAGISSYTEWPADGSEYTVLGQGFWTGTAGASLDAVNHWLVVSSDAANPLEFTPAVVKSVASGEELAFDAEVRFSMIAEPPVLPSGVKGAVTVSDKNDTAVYLGLARDAVGGTNTWVTLSGVTPDTENAVRLRILLRLENETVQVKYLINETVLTCNDAEWLDIVTTDRIVSTVGAAGNGEFVALSGTATSLAPEEMVTFTIPELDNMSVAQVRVAGVDVVPDESGIYQVVQGAVVTVTFQPAPGWALDRTTMTFIARENMSLPETGRPTAINVAAKVTINEVMAKNGVTLKTATGFEGLDWVELYNRSDDAVDLSGWYMGNDPTKKPTKWPRIEGSCIVPAHGYKIVWFDGDALCTNWDRSEAHVAANISTDAGKHTVFLASEADTAGIVQQITLPGGVKDVSYGLGHREHAVDFTGAVTQYRVGTGAWQPVEGSLGMSAAAEPFKVVTTACGPSIDTLDRAEAFLQNSAVWTEVRTNSFETIAFRDSEQAVSFPTALYQAFDTSATEHFVVVVTGTVRIPRAGDWTFDVCSDDGFAATLSRLGDKWSWESRSTRGYEHSTVTFNLEAGDYAVKLVYFQNTGTHALDFSAAEGRYEEFDASAFALVGATGSPLVHAGPLGSEIARDVSAEMVGQAKTLEWKTTFTMNETPDEGDSFNLLVRYADGFTAKLNGKTVASVEATRARSAAEALRSEGFVIEASDVVKGVNTLEITAENDAIGDTEFFLSAELSHDFKNNQFVYFPKPTPGAENASEGRTGFTPEVTFSERHGWKNAAFDLTLTCSGDDSAVIYYTLDGTSPTIGAASTFLYKGPIHIERTTVVRAAVPDADSILQVDRSATYLFYDDVIAQSGTPTGFPGNKALNSQAMVYGMRSDIVNSTDPTTREKLRRGFTESVRTVSLVIDPKHLFDKSKGIYVNATGNGRDWERQTMVEQINPRDPNDEFCVPAGLRIRGAFSRGAQYPKHSFRLFFRSEYGMGTLEHKMFGDEGADAFEKIDFRTAQNYSWANGDTGEFTFIEEVFSRDSQRDMGEPYNRSRYYNLFINGIYWGVYQTEERVDDNYAETYNGDVAANYDVIRTSQPGYSTGVAEGEAAGWEAYWSMTVGQGYASKVNYNKVRGLNEDGTRNSAYPVYLNVTNMVNYLLTAYFTGDTDCPATAGGDKPNNVQAFRNRFDRGQRAGFIWNRHDAEHSLGTRSGYNAINYDSCTLGANLTALGMFNPNVINLKLMANAEYKMTFADLVYRHMLRTGGALTPELSAARFRSRMAELDDAVVCEAARWGRSSQGYSTWTSACQKRLDFINRRTPYIIQIFRNHGWYPSVDAPSTVDDTGTAVSAGRTFGADERVYLANPGDGTVYYTTDGSDPRAEGGTVAEGALTYAGGSPATPVAEPLFAKGADWKYYDAGNRPAANWMAGDYDDSAWKTGSGCLGFANSGTFGTTLNRYVGGGTSGTQVTTFYFRKTFELPENAGVMTRLKASLNCDDGYVVYINGIEVARDQVISTDYDAFATTTNLGQKDVDFTFPAGTLKSGENVIAVEIHQCNASSTDAWWDLALSYLKPAATSAGGLLIPSQGATIAARVFKNGEWSALETVSVKGSMPRATPAEAVRVAAVMSSAPGGDTDDFLVLTNITDGVVSLENVKLVAWNAKKKSEAEASLTLVFGADRELQPGAFLMLTATDFGSEKLTNSDVGIRLYATTEATEPIQDLFVSTDWFGGICDGEGAYFVAREFGAEVKDETQWKPSESWVERNLRFYEIEGIPAEGNDGAGEYFVLTNISDSVELDLTGVRIYIGKKSDIVEDGDSAAKCIVSLANGTIAPGTMLKFTQPDYNWTKITDGDLILKIYDAEGALVQYSEIAQKNFSQYKVGEKVLRATSFDRETATTDWTEVDLPVDSVTIMPGQTVEVTAADADEATNNVVLVVEVPMVDDVPVVDEATYKGYFVLTARPVVGKDGIYEVEAQLNPELVRPVIEETEGIAVPFAVDETSVAVRVRALPGLYYSLVRGQTVNEIETVCESKLATGTTVELADLERPASAAFYRVRVSVTDGK